MAPIGRHSGITSEPTSLHSSDSGHPVRAGIVYALAHEDLCVCDVAAVAGLSISAASHQLKRLRDQGVVSYQKEGRLAFYSLRDEHIRRLVEDGVAHVQARPR